MTYTTTTDLEPRTSAPSFRPKAQLRPRHPFFHFLMLVIGVPAAILACAIIIPLRFVGLLGK
ncbi:MAG: hypothetical protein ACKVUS_17010 [Saprospiraceae bacterium]